MRASLVSVAAFVMGTQLLRCSSFVPIRSFHRRQRRQSFSLLDKPSFGSKRLSNRAKDAPKDMPVRAFFTSFAVNVCAAPVSLYFLHDYLKHPGLASTEALLCLLFSIPFAALNGLLAAIASMTINSPSFLENLDEIARSVPEEADAKGVSVVENTLEALKKKGLSSVVSPLSVEAASALLSILNPIFSLLLSFAGNVVAKLDREGSSGWDVDSDSRRLSFLVVDTILDGLGGVIGDIRSILIFFPLAFFSIILVADRVL